MMFLHPLLVLVLISTGDFLRVTAIGVTPEEVDDLLENADSVWREARDVLNSASSLRAMTDVEQELQRSVSEIRLMRVRLDRLRGEDVTPSIHGIKIELRRLQETLSTTMEEIRQQILDVSQQRIPEVQATGGRPRFIIDPGELTESFQAGVAFHVAARIQAVADQPVGRTPTIPENRALSTQQNTGDIAAPKNNFEKITTTGTRKLNCDIAGRRGQCRHVVWCNLQAAWPNSNTYTEQQTNPSIRSRETAADRNVSNHSKTSSRKDISFPGGVSDSTLYRRRRELGLLQRERYTNISDEDLDTRMRSILENDSNCGRNLAMGALRSDGVVVPTRRVSESLQRVGGPMIAARWQRPVERQPYRAHCPGIGRPRVGSPDGRTEIRLAGDPRTAVCWGITIQGGVDGYSKTCTFLSATGSNTAAFMMRAFLRGCREYGIPSRIRTDDGGENSEIGRFMVELRAASEIDLSSPLNYGTPSSRVGSTPRGSVAGTPRTRVRADIRSERKRREVNLASEAQGPPDGTEPSGAVTSDQPSGPQLVIWGTDVVVSHCKDKFRRFLSQFVVPSLDEDEMEGIDVQRPLYMQKLEEVAISAEPFLNVNCGHLKDFDANLYRQLICYPQEVIPTFDVAVNELFLEKFPDASLEHQVQVRPYNVEKTTNMRNLNPEDIDQLITIGGMVIRTSNLVPEMMVAFFRCHVCHWTTTVEIDRGRIAEPTLCRNCSTQHSMALVHNRSQFGDKQMVKLQESPGGVVEQHSMALVHNRSQFMDKQMVKLQESPGKANPCPAGEVNFPLQYCRK
ncbi:DNA replication licensing factor, mcm4 component [Branchiostoma belcheri]|nr:DNA replication licensing factor, mcm4 component [Branchiostoma belcheri]